MLHPNVQRKAQEQLDEVVGRDRLPEFGDLEHCPYVRAIVMEVLRWQPVAPLGESRKMSIRCQEVQVVDFVLAIARCMAADDEYRGYHIPKGSFVMGNAL